MSALFSEVLFTTPLFIGSLLVLVALSKLANLESFVASVADYEILPISLVRPFASCLPFVEVVLGFSLLVGFRIQLAKLYRYLSLFCFRDCNRRQFVAR